MSTHTSINVHASRSGEPLSFRVLRNNTAHSALDPIHATSPVLKVESPSQDLTLFLSNDHLLQLALVVRGVICESCDGEGSTEKTLGGDDTEYGAASAQFDAEVVCGECAGTGIAS
jgi:hypothetical protein